MGLWLEQSNRILRVQKNVSDRQGLQDLDVQYGVHHEKAITEWAGFICISWLWPGWVVQKTHHQGRSWRRKYQKRNITRYQTVEASGVQRKLEGDEGEHHQKAALANTNPECRSLTGKAKHSPSLPKSVNRLCLRISIVWLPKQP